MSTVKFEVAEGVTVAETNHAGTVVRVEKGKPFETADPGAIAALDAFDSVVRAPKSGKGDA